MSEQLITKREEVKALLRKLFRSEDADLDFGIYRIMNYKRREIEQFIERDLIETAEAEFKQYARVGTVELEKELERLKLEINSNFGTRTIDSEGRVTRNHDAPKVQRYLRTQEEYRAASLTEEQVNDVFNHVYEFFSRYYYDGDFIVRPRDSWRSKYSIPYKGEEVTFHWATKNMYYIKTGEFFKKYNFKAGRYRVSFVLVHAQVETGNAKSEKKFFILSDEEPVQIDETVRAVETRFNYRSLSDVEKEKYGTRNIQATIVSDILEKMRSLLESSSIVGILRPRGGEEKSLMEKHLNAYVKRNTKDFFIHKDLKGFLEREFDFYLKNEVWSLDELESLGESGARLLEAKAKTIRGISLKIIEFLSQMEEFQKKLFEKKKFVFRTDYCMTLDLVPEEFYEEIGRNEMQVSEWKELYKLDEITNGNFHSTKGKTALTIDFLKQYKYMALDTKHFSDEFKYKLLSDFDNIDDSIKGLMIKSENWHALNLIKEKYKEKIKFTYIDPPYNTGSDDFIYKDNYQNSSWLTMKENRLTLARELMSDDGTIFISIDDNEIDELKKICLQNRFYLVVCFVRKSGIAPRMDVKFIATEHDYVLCLAKNLEKLSINKQLADLEGYPIQDEFVNERGKFKLNKLDRGSIHYSESLDYPINITKGTIINLVTGSEIREYEAEEDVQIWPGGDPLDKKWTWRWSKNKVEWGIQNHMILFKKLKDHWSVYFKQYQYVDNKLNPLKREVPYRTLLLNFTNEMGTREIRDLFGKSDVFTSYPKPVSLVKHLINVGSTPTSIILDFFAGSGTTAHAVINLNMKDSAERKYILLEMADYFDTVMLPRIKKVIFSREWKNSIPLNNEGISHFFKYQYLEQYEDTLNNIEFISPDGTIQKTLERFPDYFISHMLDYETRDSPSRLSIEQFKTPFNYKIKTLSSGEEREEPVDLVETFNYLLGLHIRRIQTYEDGDRVYRAVFGERDREQVAVIWRDTFGLDLRRDKSFIEENILTESTFNTIYVNGDSYIRGAKPIEPEFRRLMDA